MVKWFESYFEKRSQRVKCNNILSEELLVKHGVPQESKLGPIVFIIYINDVVNKLKDCGCKCKLFVDDMMLYVDCGNLEYIENVLNQGLKKLDVWLKCNLLKINVKKPFL